jgi:hypothetical protein
MQAEDFFKQLVDNAFDFFNNSLTNLEHKPKFALIDFYTGIELCLKARLLHEHWSLIVLKDPDISKFKAGNFISLGLSDSIKKLGSVQSIILKQNTHDIFIKLGEDRNKMVHFHHSITSQQRTDKDRDDIINKICTAWHAFFDLLEDKNWCDVFKEYKSKIDTFQNELLKNNQYLEFKYKPQKKDLEDRKQKGEDISNCSKCGYNSFQYKERFINDIATGKYKYCSVCNFENEDIEILKINCTFCTKTTSVKADNYQCTHCANIISTESLLKSWYLAGMDSGAVDYSLYEILGLGEYIDGNCNKCNESTLFFEPDYMHAFCISCFNYIESNSMTRCEYCGELIFEYDGEPTYEYGCDKCTGNLGRKLEKDD